MTDSIKNMTFFNPATAQVSRGGHQAEHSSYNKIARDIAKNVDGFVPMNQRRGGEAKVVGYHITNFFSAGIMNAVGGIAANSNYMRPEKANGNWFDRMMHDLSLIHI